MFGFIWVCFVWVCFLKNSLGRTRILDMRYDRYALDRFGLSSPWCKWISVSIVPMISLDPYCITSHITTEPYGTEMNA